MKTYPKMDYWNKGRFGEYCYLFNKLDGSNLRYQFSRKRGWYKFGSRNVMIDENTPILGEGVTIFLNTWADELEKIFKQKEYRNIDQFIAFGEFYGENSFAGQHVDTDIKKVSIFDIDQYKKGFVPPKQFIEDFGHLNIPKVFYQGEYTQEMIDEVRNNKILKEGVVSKGVYKSKGKDVVWSCKIKTNEWLQKVKEKFGEKLLLEEVNGNKELFNLINI
jgi:hypothetical protein